MRKQTNAYGRGRKAGAVVLALGLASTGATYIAEQVTAKAAPVTRGQSAPNSAAAAATVAGAGGSAGATAKLTRPTGSLARAIKARPRRSQPEKQAHSPRPPRLRTELGAVSMEREILEGQRDVFSGSLRPRLKRRPVLLQVREDHRWSTVARTRTGARGRYRLSYQPAFSGTVALRVVFPGGLTARPTHRRLGELDIYRLAVASWYASGGVTACGNVLTSSTMGVANKTLPCGTMVTLRYAGRSVTVPVIDRGPFVPGREFDLTEATKNALGFEGVGQLWAIY